MLPGEVAILSGLVIGLALRFDRLALSGFCMMSSLRGWWAEGDGRLVRTYALAMGVAIAASQLLAARGAVDLGKSIYLQPSFSAPVMFFGGMLFGYGMVLSNGCGSRALVLLGQGQSALARGGDRARHLRRDDAEGPDRAGADRGRAGHAGHGEDQFAAGAAVELRPQRGLWRGCSRPRWSARR